MSCFKKASPSLQPGPKQCRRAVASSLQLCSPGRKDAGLSRPCGVHLGTGAVAGGKMIECSHKASTPISNCSMEKLLLKGSCHVCNTRKTTCARDAA